MPNTADGGGYSDNNMLPKVRNTSRFAKRAKDASSPAVAAGYVNLRIKSSKAFPLGEVSAIGEIINKVKMMKNL